MTTYEELYNRALAKLDDPTLMVLPEEDLEEMLHGYLESSIAKFRKCENDLEDRDEELKAFNCDLALIEKEILAIMMVREWIGQRLYSVTNVMQVFGGKEEKFYSQSAHVAELRELDERLQVEAQKLSRDYTYQHNPYVAR